MSVLKYWAMRGFPNPGSATQFGVPELSYGTNVPVTEMEFPFDQSLIQGSFGTCVGSVGFQGTWRYTIWDSSDNPLVRINCINQGNTSLQTYDGTEWVDLFSDTTIINNNVATNSAINIRWNSSTVSIERYSRETLLGARVDFSFSDPLLSDAAKISVSNSNSSSMRLMYAILTDSYSVDMSRYRVIQCTLSTTPTVQDNWNVGQVTGTNGYAVGPNDVIPATTYSLEDSAELLHSNTLRSNLIGTEKILSTTVHATLSEDDSQSDVVLVGGNPTSLPSDPQQVEQLRQILTSKFTVENNSPLRCGIVLVPKE